MGAPATGCRIPFSVPPGTATSTIEPGVPLYAVVTDS